MRDYVRIKKKRRATRCSSYDEARHTKLYCAKVARAKGKPAGKKSEKTVEETRT